MLLIHNVVYSIILQMRAILKDEYFLCGHFRLRNMPTNILWLVYVYCEQSSFTLGVLLLE